MQDSILDVIEGDDQPQMMENFLKNQQKAPETNTVEQDAVKPPQPSQPFEPTESLRDFAPASNGRPFVVLKNIRQAKFRMGLENTPEKFQTMPGTTQRWAPKKVGRLYRTGLDRNELAPTKDERKVRIAQLEHELGKKLDDEFYANMSYIIDSNKPHGEKLYLDKAENLVIYLAMLESDQVASGLHEYRSGAKPFAEWYIEDKEAEAEVEAKERTDKLKAGRLFEEMSEQKKKKVAIILGLDVQGLSPRAAENVLWKWIENENPKPGETKLKNLRTFLDLVKKGDTFLAVSETVHYAIRFNILRANNTGDIFYGDSLIGTTKEQVIAKLMSTQYSELRMGIETKVETEMNRR